MSMRRLFVDALPRAGGVVSLPAASVRHARVLRLEPGAHVCLFDGRASEAAARVQSITRDAVRCEAAPPVHVDLPLPRVHVLCGLAKGDKLEGAVRMLTELGAHGVHPVTCQRSIAQPKRSEARHARLVRIAREACAQSGQARAPEVHAPMPLDEAAALAPRDAVKLVFWEEETTGDLDAALAGQHRPAPELWIVIGPEGGLAEDEVKRLAQLGYGVAGLGDATLRVETAVPVAVALAMDRVGRLRPRRA